MNSNRFVNKQKQQTNKIEIEFQNSLVKLSVSVV